MKRVMTWLGVGLAAVFLAVAGARAENAVRLSAADFGAVPDDGKDDTEAFQKLFAAAAQATGPVVIEVAPGRYDFFPEKATRRACYASNAIDLAPPVRTIALDLQGLKDVTVAGKGAEFLMHGKMTLLVAENCQNLTLEGLAFDMARPAVSEITVTGVEQNVWTAKVHPDCRHAVEGNRMVWIGEDWRCGDGLTQQYDPETNTTWRSDDPFAHATAIAEPSPGLLQVTSAKPVDFPVGRVFQFRDGVRDQVGMWFNHCRNLVLRDVDVHATAGFGLLSQFTDGITFERVRVAPREGSGRTCASSADVFHFSMCRGEIVLRDCRMEGAQDDAVNVHGIAFKVVARPAANQITVAFSHGQTYGFQAFWPGEELEFVAQPTLLPIGRAKVTAVAAEAGGRQQTLTLDQAPPEALVLNRDVVENLAWIPSVTITGCHVARIPTRGFLLTTRNPVVVENNVFERTRMPAILVSDDASNWFESGAVHDMTIQGNTFLECAEPVIDIRPENAVDGGPVHSNIRIVDNTFVLDRHAVAVRSSDEIRVEGNTFVTRANPLPKPPDFIQKDAKSGVRIEGNRVEKATPERVRQIAGTAD